MKKHSFSRISSHIEDRESPIADARRQKEIDGQGKAGPNNAPAVQPFVVEDEDWNRLKGRYWRLRWVLGIDDDDFCEGLVYQLSEILRYDDETNFEFVLSFLKDAKPVDNLHATLLVQMAVCHLAMMKQSQVLLKPVSFELPADFQLAIHHAKYDTSRLDKQKIRIDDLQVRQAGERAFSRLMQTYALQLQISAAYRKSVEVSAKPQQAFAITEGQAVLTGGTVTAHVGQKTAAGRSPGKLNGSRQSAGRVSRSSKERMNAIHVQKSNGRASS
jgi:hypothetical protein